MQSNYNEWRAKSTLYKRDKGKEKKTNIRPGKVWLVPLCVLMGGARPGLWAGVWCLISALLPASSLPVCFHHSLSDAGAQEEAETDPRGSKLTDSLRSGGQILISLQPT